MDKKLLQRIERETDTPGIIRLLCDRLSSSDLNSLLLEVFSEKTAKMTPAGLLNAYTGNRFVQPSSIDPIAFGEFSLKWMKAARTAGFYTLELSPLAPLGSCSAVGTVHQNKVLTALRGTEVVADATNVMALESAYRRKRDGFPEEVVHLSAVHRHVRAQEVPKMPGFSAHFGVFALTSAGRDTGSFQFEKENLLRHIRFYKTFFEQELQIAPVKMRLKTLSSPEEENRCFDAAHSFLLESEPDWPVEIIESAQQEQEYYRRLQFKVVIPGPDHAEIEIADGGFTDWTQQLNSNRKERMLISGLGLELLFKIICGLL